VSLHGVDWLDASYEACFNSGIFVRSPPSLWTNRLGNSLVCSLNDCFQNGSLGAFFFAVSASSAGEEGGGCTSSWLDGGDSYGGEDDIVESQCPGGVSGRFSGQDHHGPWSAEGTSMLYSFIAQCM